MTASVGTALLGMSVREIAKRSRAVELLEQAVSRLPLAEQHELRHLVVASVASLSKNERDAVTQLIEPVPAGASVEERAVRIAEVVRNEMEAYANEHGHHYAPGRRDPWDGCIDFDGEGFDLVAAVAKALKEHP